MFLVSNLLNFSCFACFFVFGIKSSEIQWFRLFLYVFGRKSIEIQRFHWFLYVFGIKSIEIGWFLMFFLYIFGISSIGVCWFHVFLYVFGIISIETPTCSTANMVRGFAIFFVSNPLKFICFEHHQRLIRRGDFSKRQKLIEHRDASTKFSAYRDAISQHMMECNFPHKHAEC